MHELSLRPYHGRLYLAANKTEFEAQYAALLGKSCVLGRHERGRFAGCEADDGAWTYLVWASSPHSLAHELAHVVLHVFDLCGIDPRSGDGGPFCYLLSQLLLDAAGVADAEKREAGG